MTALRRVARVFLALALGGGATLAAKLPSPEAIESVSHVEPVTLAVIEPHESAPGRPVVVAYRAFPAPAALAAALGPDWARRGGAIEFRALDGYVSRIDAARLTSGKAYLAFARADGKPFTVNNLGQNEKDILLGPYYLVWDNRDDPALIAAGAGDWPYQTAEVAFASDPDAALKPEGFDPKLAPGLAAAKAHCLVCHSVNGWGGDKLPVDLAVIARRLPRADLLLWALSPTKADPKSTMPALLPDAPEAKRRAVAADIADYLVGVPIVGR